MPYYQLSAEVKAFPLVSVVAAHLALSLTVAYYLKTDVQLKLRGFDQICCGADVSVALGHFLMFAQWPFEISIQAINSSISMGPLCAFPALCKSAKPIYTHASIQLFSIYVYRHVVMYVLPISGTSGSLSSLVCANQYLLFTLRLSVASGQSTFNIFRLWQTCSASTSAITAGAGLDTGIVTGLVPRFKSFCYALLFRLMPLKKIKERKKKRPWCL